jgi:hypothetical protein
MMAKKKLKIRTARVAVTEKTFSCNGVLNDVKELIAQSLRTAAPIGDGLRKSGSCRLRRRRALSTWPIWELALQLAAIRTLLQHPLA